MHPDGSIEGVSVDLWRRSARAPLDSRLADGNDPRDDEFEAAIGAIMVTPERLARVDVSYPARRSGVGVAVRKDCSPQSLLTASKKSSCEVSDAFVCRSKGISETYSRGETRIGQVKTKK